VLQIDERGIEAGVTDDFNDLRIGYAADVRAEGKPAFADDLFYAVRLHEILLYSYIIDSRAINALNRGGEK
jgi:hypothetical protein